MNIREYRSFFITELLPWYDAMEAENFFHLALEQYRGLHRSDLAMQPELEFDQHELAQWDEVLRKLKAEIPIQYILGQAHFCGLEFKVNPSVLIPRPETEELVEWIVSDNQFRPNLAILDIGTGSGCIAISVAKMIDDAHVFAIDISSEALTVARLNAEFNKTDVVFEQRDILEVTSLDRMYDIIVSNPPYVRNLEKHEIRNNVLDNEPHLALFVDDLDPLLFYRKIAGLAITALSENGKLYFEINQYLADETVEMLRNLGFKNIEVRKDIYGNDRMVSAEL